VINVKNKSHAVVAEIEVPRSGPTGVIAAQGTGMGGWSLYADDGRLKYFYNFLGLLHFVVEAESPLSPGTYQVRMEFAYDGDGIGRGATVTLYVDGVHAAAGRIGRTHALEFSIDETLKVGCDKADPVVPGASSYGDTFSGKINWVKITVAATPTDEEFAFASAVRGTKTGVRALWRTGASNMETS